MKIYDFPMAPNPRRVRIFLAEKNVDMVYVHVDITKGENRTTAFIEKNPMGGLPVLEFDDGTYLTESVAICRYFEGMYPTPPLMGTDPRDIAFVEMWNRRMEFNILQPIADAFRQRHDFFKGRIRQLAEYAEVQRLNAEDGLDWLDRELAARRFIAGEQFSIADITAVVAIDFGRVSKIAIKPDQLNLARWHAEVSARPSAKA